MGPERRMFTELEPPNAVKEIDHVELWAILFEIASGTNSFGHLREWDDWFTYLLPDLIERSIETRYFDTTIFQSVVTAFMAIFWNGIDEVYAGFRQDVLASLSVTMMDERFWSLEENPPRPAFLDVQEDGFERSRLFWGFGETDPSVTAALFFCLKYLRPEEMTAWIESVVGIAHPLWQGNLMVWFHKAFDGLQRGQILPGYLEAVSPKLQWEDSHLLIPRQDADASAWPEFHQSKDFLPDDNVKACFEQMKAYYSDDKLIELGELFSQNEHIALSTHNLPEQLMAKLRE
jgi:hypothetical protein